MPETSNNVALILARLDEMDRARSESTAQNKAFQERIESYLAEIRVEVKATNGRVGVLEKDKAREEGRVAEREGQGKARARWVGTSAGAVSVLAFLIDKFNIHAG